MSGGGKERKERRLPRSSGKLAIVACPAGGKDAHPAGYSSSSSVPEGERESAYRLVSQPCSLGWGPSTLGRSVSDVAKMVLVGDGAVASAAISRRTHQMLLLSSLFRVFFCVLWFAHARPGRSASHHARRLVAVAGVLSRAWRRGRLPQGVWRVRLISTRSFFDYTRGVLRVKFQPCENRQVFFAYRRLCVGALSLSLRGFCGVSPTGREHARLGTHFSFSGVREEA